MVIELKKIALSASVLLSGQYLSSLGDQTASHPRQYYLGARRKGRRDRRNDPPSRTVDLSRASEKAFIPAP